MREEAANEKTRSAILKLKSKMATYAVPSIEELMNLKLALEREKAATKTMERKLYLKRLAEKNQQIRHVVLFENFFVYLVKTSWNYFRYSSCLLAIVRNECAKHPDV